MSARPEERQRTEPVPVAKVGNLTDHPELRHGQSGTAFTTFGLAWKPYTPKGQPEAQPTFYEVVCFGSLAENVVTSLGKGDRAVVVGKGEMDTWTGKDGIERHKRKIIADAIGPDLRFVTVEMSRRDRSDSDQPRLDEEPF